VRRIGDVIDTFRPPGTAIDAVHLGGGACTLARYVLATRPRSTNEVYEHDPGVLDLAREHLGLRTSPRLRVRIGDAAQLLARRDDAGADVVIGDAFVRQDIPEPLTTLAFTSEVRRVLRPAGVYVLNVVDTRGLPLARAHAATLGHAFAHIAAIAPRSIVRRRAGGNVILVASRAALPLDALAARAAGSVDREEIVSLRHHEP
jgi:spermidine synthase